MYVVVYLPVLPFSNCELKSEASVCRTACIELLVGLPDLLQCLDEGTLSERI